MKVCKIFGVMAICILLALTLSSCAKNDGNNSSQTSSVISKYSYAENEFNDEDKLAISEFFINRYGSEYTDTGTEYNFPIHYTPMATVEYNGVSYYLVKVEMNVLDMSTGEVGDTILVDAYAISMDYTELYEADVPSNGKVEIDFSKNFIK